ncbi:MAG: RluA family pseudouridine synthase [Acidobacteriota bacterium]|nr:RluA family pseudouridine synthase [Acidobacteriota bacterium]MDH3786416.1 RluA family pseudouridine synthase [Acidobacteriota bacterium]
MTAESGDERWSFSVDEEADGQRLDHYLSGHFPHVTRSSLRRWIDGGHVTVNGKSRPKAGLSLQLGQTIVVVPPPPPASSLTPESIPLPILYRDDHLVVIDKPAGIVVHPGHGCDSGTLVHGLLGLGIRLSTVGGDRRPGIVHRLDRETSGALVVACTDAAHLSLSQAFAERRVTKQYNALVWGRPQETSGTIDRGIGRSSRDPTRMTVRETRGPVRSAVTHFRTVEEMPGFALLDIGIETGRTHQIRVHLQSMHHPVVGDERYGGRPWKGVQDPRKRKALREFERLALHAHRLEFAHPVTGETICCEAPLPESFQSLLEILREDA